MKITNWERWQSFRKDRGTPPWIKVYRNLMSNHEWVQLTDSEKGQLVSIWILAADKNGSIPDCPTTIQKMCLLDKKPNINKFKELGFMTSSCQPVGCQGDANMTHQSRVEESRGEKSRGEKKRFAIPSLSEIKEVIKDKNYNVNPDNFFNHYETNGWMVGKNKMKSWTAALASWNGREMQNQKKKGSDSNADVAKRFLDAGKTIEGEYNVVK